MIETLKKLLSLSTENEIVEFKEAKATYDKDKLGKYFSALSNEANLASAPCAYMVFGVNDAKEVVGTSINQSMINRYKQEISEHTSPSITFKEVSTVETDEGSVIIFVVPAAPKSMPVSWKGHYYARNGESLSALNIEKVERIRRQITTKDWSAQIIEEASLADLSTEALHIARTEFKKKNPRIAHEVDDWDDTTFLNNAKVCIDGKITSTAILLLGNPESEHFITPSSARITWLLKDKDNIEKDYEHYSCPFILSVDAIQKKVRNLRYRYIKYDTLFPDEVDQYDPYIIREALHNCIAHQDYEMGGKIVLVEHEDGVLTFVNSGDFIPESIEHVITSDAPEDIYRNPFLVKAMVNLNMIDTIGSGIKKMFVIQKNKYFPLPEYDFTNDKVKVQIIGKVIDVNYARKLAQMKDLSLQEIYMLDKVAKRKRLNPDEIKLLKQKKLIEGRKPNFHISSAVASLTGEKAKYIKQRGVSDDYYMKMIVDYIEEFGEGKKADFEKLLLDKLPDILNTHQKSNKIKNLLQKLKSNGRIYPEGKVWKMSK